MALRRIAFVLTLMYATALLCGCAQQSQNGLPAGVIAPDEETKQRAAAFDPADFDFVTAETVDAVSYGMIGDGVTDNTTAFRNLLAAGNRTIHIPPGDYVTSSVEFAANTRLMLEAGVTLRDAGRLQPGERLLNIRVTNVTIRGLGARVVADRVAYPTGEQRHGVYLYGAHQVLIEGLEASSHGGDGFYIGGARDNPSTDIMLTGCLADNNRRQGVSITSARRVRIIDCDFINTNGTAPEYGIDLEPNHPYDLLDDIILLRPHTAGNRGGDIMVALQALDASSEHADISILDHATRDAPRLSVSYPPVASVSLRYSAAAK